MPQGEHVGRVIRDAPAQARLTDAVKEPEVLVPGEGRRQCRSLLFVYDPYAARGVLAGDGPARVDALFDARDLVVQFVIAVACDDDYDIRLAARPAEDPVIRVALGLFVHRIAEDFNGARWHPLLESLVGESFRLKVVIRQTRPAIVRKFRRSIPQGRSVCGQGLQRLEREGDVGPRSLHRLRLDAPPVSYLLKELVKLQHLSRRGDKRDEPAQPVAELFRVYDLEEQQGLVVFVEADDVALDIVDSEHGLTRRRNGCLLAALL